MSHKLIQQPKSFQPNHVAEDPLFPHPIPFMLYFNQRKHSYPPLITMEKTLIIFTIFTHFLCTVNTALIASDPITVTDDSVKTQTFIVKSIDQSPRFIFSRPHPIKHQFHGTNYQIPLRFVKRHPCRKFLKTVMIPRSYGNDAIVDSKSLSFDTETIGNDQVPQKWLEFKHSYGHLHHHEHHGDQNEVHKEKKTGYKGGFATRISKFMKHTFE